MKNKSNTYSCMYCGEEHSFIGCPNKDKSTIPKINFYDKKNVDAEKCLIDQFFKDQEKLPKNRRTNYCMISCRCSKCSPTIF